MTTAQMNDPERDGDTSVGIPVDRTVRRACQGAQTMDCRRGPEHGQRCRECGTWVRDDMTNHPFFGFKAGCQQREKT